MTGYAGKKQKWQEEEAQAAAAGQENPLAELDERAHHFFYARRPKKVKEGMTKYNEPQTEKVEKAVLAVHAA